MEGFDWYRCWHWSLCWARLPREIAPPKIKGTVGALSGFILNFIPLNSASPLGTLFQLSIVFGIFFTHSIGLYLATLSRWRLVLLFSSAFSICQIFVGSAATESPAWLSGNGRAPEAESVETRLFGKSNAYEPIMVDPESPLGRNSSWNGGLKCA